jgi:hypothetical protein
MRYRLISLSMLFVLLVLFLLFGSAHAQINVGVSLPGISIGINMPAYPNLVQVPGYPVYYDPRVNSNYFFYDGQYWVYQNDNWYASSWYDGPWQLIGPEEVPLFVLRVPVRYYRQPPDYFRGWSGAAPPRWGDHWGPSWQQSRPGWDQWDHRAAPRPAPLPVYQKQYKGDRYPRTAEQQHSIQSGLNQPQSHTQPQPQPQPRIGSGPGAPHNGPSAAQTVAQPAPQHASKPTVQHVEPGQPRPSAQQLQRVRPPDQPRPAPPAQRPQPTEPQGQGRDNPGPEEKGRGGEERGQEHR